MKKASWLSSAYSLAKLTDFHEDFPNPNNTMGFEFLLKTESNCFVFAHLQSAWCIWRRSSQSLCWLTRCRSPHWSDCSEQSTVTSRRNSWRMARRSVSSPSHLAPSLWSCCHSIGLNPAKQPHSAAPNPTCSTGCSWSVRLSWCLEGNQRLPAEMWVVPGSMVFPSVWPARGASLVGKSLIIIYPCMLDYLPISPGLKASLEPSEPKAYIAFTGFSLCIVLANSWPGVSCPFSRTDVNLSPELYNLLCPRNNSGLNVCRHM